MRNLVRCDFCGAETTVGSEEAQSWLLLGHSGAWADLCSWQCARLYAGRHCPTGVIRIEYGPPTVQRTPWQSLQHFLANR